MDTLLTTSAEVLNAYSVAREALAVRAAGRAPQLPYARVAVLAVQRNEHVRVRSRVPVVASHRCDAVALHCTHIILTSIYMAEYENTVY